MSFDSSREDKKALRQAEPVTTIGQRRELKGILSPPGQPTRPRVLLVDDDEHFLEFIGAALSERFDVVKAENGEAALKEFLHERPNLVITDMCMPKMSGFELIRVLHDYPSTPIIALSGYDVSQTSYDSASLIETSVMKVLRKPCTVAEVCQAAEHIIANARKLR